jgi:hypothetical protein
LQFEKHFLRDLLDRQEIPNQLEMKHDRLFVIIERVLHHWVEDFEFQLLRLQPVVFVAVCGRFSGSGSTRRIELLCTPEFEHDG